MAFTCPHCGALHVDATDEKAERNGLLYFAEAARQLGRSTSYVHSLISQYVLRTGTMAGRTYVTQESVNRVIKEVGVPDPDDTRLEELQRSGHGWSTEAQALQARQFDRMYAHQRAEEKQFGGSALPGTVSRAAETLPDPFARYAALYGQGGK